MGFSEIVERLDVTRARIESGVSEPTVIAITSAKVGDGKALLATALAHSFSSVGYRVLLVGANQYAPLVEGVRSAPKISDRPEFDILAYAKPDSKGGPDVLELTAPGVAGSCSKESTDATFARFRANYPFTIVYTSVLAQSGVAFSFVSSSDQVVLAFRTGRAADDADRKLLELLKSADATVAGTVMMDRRAIRAFETERKGSLQPARLNLTAHSEEAKAASVRVRAG